MRQLILPMYLTHPRMIRQLWWTFDPSIDGSTSQHHRLKVSEKILC